MKSTISIRLAVSAVAACAAATALACGPYSPIIPTPDYFISGYSQKAISDNDREENLRLWQEQTSKSIPVSDIEEAVYKDTYSRFAECTGYAAAKTGNLFYTYLNNSGDREVTDLLLTAKRLEKLREEMLSPWYYPRNKENGNNDLDDIIDKCKAYKGSRLRDRYALQTTRAIFASKNYAGCIEYYDSAFADIPDGNLMKRMAQRYVAGCWSRLDDKERADSVFAAAGDIRSITCSDPLAYMAERNPDAPLVMEYLRDKRCARDTALMTNAAAIAYKLLAADKVTNKGDWNFMLAYFNNEFKGNTQLAREHIYKALQQKFSSSELNDLARAYKMKLDAKSGHSESLLEDMQWAESKTDILNPDAYQWKRRIRNIVYEDLVPRLWSDKEYSKAILLCAYADNLDYADRRYTIYQFGPGWLFAMPDISMTINDLRKSEKFFNPLDYSCLSFQLMGSLTSDDLATAYDEMMQPGTLNDFLRRNIRTDCDYYNELIGTLALREGNYERAESYLSKVSEEYQRTMNINKKGYLSRDAFSIYPSRWSTTDYFGWAYENQAVAHEHQARTGAKLDFARKMNSYAETMAHGATNDERGLAALMHTIGRHNSFEECWALTQYWRGFCSNMFYPSLQYWDNFAESKYPFLYDYVNTVGYKNTEDEYNRNVEKALAMLESNEAKAKAEYILGNLKTVVARYGDTTTGQFVKTSCDNWKQWI